MKARSLFLLFTLGLSVQFAQTGRAQLADGTTLRAADANGNLRTLLFVTVDKVPNANDRYYFAGKFDFAWAGSPTSSKPHNAQGTFTGFYSAKTTSGGKQLIYINGASEHTHPELTGNLMPARGATIVAVLATTDWLDDGSTPPATYIP